jgi:hypothetical protein
MSLFFPGIMKYKCFLENAAHSEWGISQFIHKTKHKYTRLALSLDSPPPGNATSGRRLSHSTYTNCNTDAKLAETAFKFNVAHSGSSASTIPANVSCEILRWQRRYIALRREVIEKNKCVKILARDRSQSRKSGFLLHANTGRGPRESGIGVCLEFGWSWLTQTGGIVSRNLSRQHATN